VQEYGHEDMVIILVGDHEGAPRITGDWRSHDVPIHILSYDANVMEAFTDWQWEPGLLPSDEAPLWRMDTFRNRVVDTFSGLP
jgi:hypothetical protein